jgi:nondiscriminating glutamyl-tRNA synthetase
VRTALFNFLFARHHKGAMILRIEDTDLERNVPGAERELLDGFRWLGLTWDEGPDVGGPFGPYRCTERLPLYREALDRLREHGFVYPCFCTPEELEAERQEALREGRVPRYSGRCRNLTDAERERRLRDGEVPNWRFAVPSGLEIEIDDLVHGRVVFRTDDIGDFVVFKSNGIPTYNFQVVVDDAAMRITHVIRGEEHLSNTPRQWLVYQALGFQVPRFAHLPQVLDQNRKKLSKRDPNVKPVRAYHEDGYIPDAIVNFLALLGWSPGGEEEILSLPELIERFDLDRVNRSGAVFDVDKLRWMAGQYMKRTPLPDVVRLVEAQLARHGLRPPEGVHDNWLADVVSLFQEQLVCAAEFVDLARGFFDPSVEWSQEALEVLRDPGAQVVVRAYRELVDEGDWTPEASRARFQAIQQRLGVKGKALYMPVRAAVTGQTHGPDLQRTIACLPRSWVKARIDDLLVRIRQEAEAQ